jgi:uncharacterized protein YdeI (YjbR/CyaY-like superfamily)
MRARSQLPGAAAPFHATRSRVDGAPAAANRSTQRDGRWEAAYASQKNITIPDDFQSALDRNPKAAAFFATLRSAERYSFLFRIQTAKKVETRAKRIRQFVEMLKRGEKIQE